MWPTSAFQPLQYASSSLRVQFGPLPSVAVARDTVGSASSGHPTQSKICLALDILGSLRVHEESHDEAIKAYYCVSDVFLCFEAVSMNYPKLQRK